MAGRETASVQFPIAAVFSISASIEHFDAPAF
jgi:hypothetical protein